MNHKHVVHENMVGGNIFIGFLLKIANPKYICQDLNLGLLGCSFPVDLRIKFTGNECVLQEI